MNAITNQPNGRSCFKLQEVTKLKIDDLLILQVNKSKAVEKRKREETWMRGQEQRTLEEMEDL